MICCFGLQDAAGTGLIKALPEKGFLRAGVTDCSFVSPLAQLQPCPRRRRKKVPFIQAPPDFFSVSSTVQLLAGERG